MKRDTLYFRLSVVWLVILAGGLAFICGSGKGALRSMRHLVKSDPFKRRLSVQEEV